MKIAFHHIRQAISIYLVISNPAPQIGPVNCIANKMNFPYFAYLLFAHEILEFPVRKQGQDLFEIEVCDWNLGRHLIL